MNLHEDFAKRCLYKSLEFIDNIDLQSKDFVMSASIQKGITYFNQKNYTAIQNLDFDNSCANTTSCKYGDMSALKFLKIYAKLIERKILKLDTFVIDPSIDDLLDPYFLYLKAHVVDNNKSIDLLLKALQLNNYFFDAFEELLKYVNLDNFYFVQERLELIITDYIVKRLYFLYIGVYKFITCDNFDIYTKDIEECFDVAICSKPNSSRNMSIETKKTTNNYIIGLLGSVYYFKKDYDRSLSYFTIVNNKNIYFMDLYSNLLYIKNDIKKLALLSHHLSVNHPFAGETYTTIANYYSLKKERDKAIEYFKKSIEIDERFTSNYTLIGHEYIELSNPTDAIVNYNSALKYCDSDHRAFFGMGQALKSIGSTKQALYFYQKTCELQNDQPYFWMNLGACAADNLKYDIAVQAYQRSIDLGEIDALVKLADCYKNMKKYEEAVKLYEKYVESCLQKGIECKKICKFLTEFYKKIGNTKKHEFYSKIDTAER